VLQVDGKFILLNDGSIYFDKIKISNIKYISIRSIPATSHRKDLCIGLSINGNVYNVARNEKRFEQLSNIVYIELSGMTLIAIDKDDVFHRFHLDWNEIDLINNH
jgi:hypothetical protein